MESVSQVAFYLLKKKDETADNSRIWIDMYFYIETDKTRWIVEN